MSNVDEQAMELEEEVELLKQDPMIQQLISQYMSGKLMEALTKRSQAESIGNPPPPVQMPIPGMEQGGQQGQAPGRRMSPPIPATPNPLVQQLAGMRSQTPMSSTQGRGVNAGGNK